MSDTWKADNGTVFTVGDIITTYHKGYWRLTHIERRYYTERDVSVYHPEKKVGEEYSALLNYELVMDSNFKQPKSKKPRTNQCDAHYCQPVTKERLAAMKGISAEQHDDFCEGCDKLAKLL